jgi:hypothetical protein
MANRPYLYFTDDISALTFEMRYLKNDGSERSYMDARHWFPLAWFLFFDANSIKLVSLPDQEWQDLYLVRPWHEARAAFEARVPLLLEWFKGELIPSDVAEFLRTVESQMEAPNEIWLVLDPSELEIDDETGAPMLRAIYEKLENNNVSSRAKYEVLAPWSGVQYFDDLESRRERLHGRIYGFSYQHPRSASH